MDKSFFKASRPFIPSALFLATFAIYLYGLLPSLGTGDTGELITAGHTLGIAHSPGYPLFVLWGKLFSTLIPWGNPGYVMNACSAFTASLMIVTIFIVLRRICLHVILAILLACICAVIPGFWLGAHQTEVFALNGLAAAGIIGIMICARDSSNRIPERLTAFLFGISMGNQHTLILILPAVLVWFFMRLHRWHPGAFFKTVLKECGICLFFLVLGGTIYAFLPIRSLTQPFLDWEDPETFSRFWHVVTRSRYGSFQLAQGKASFPSPGDIWIQITFFTRLLKESIGWGMGALLIGGMITAGIRIKDLKNQVLLLAFIAAGPGIFFMANVRPGPSTTYIMSRFMLLCFIPAIYLIGGFLERFSRSDRKVKMSGIAVFCVLLFITRLQASLDKGVLRRDDYFVRDFGKNVLKHLPPNTLLFSDRADELEFSMAYFLYARRARSDVRFIDCNAGVSRSVYGPDYYSIWGKPRLAIREKIEKMMIQSTDRPVMYGTNDPAMISIERIPVGFLYRVPGTGRPLLKIPWDMLLIRARGDLRGDIRQKFLFENVNNLLAKHLLADGFEESSERIIRLLRSSGESKKWLLLSAYRYHEKKEYRKAEERYLYLLKRYGSDPEVHVYLGAVYNDTARFSLAEDHFRTALALDPAHAQGHFNLAVCYWHKEKWRESAEEFRRTLVLEPQNANAQKFYQRALQKAGSSGE